jgi:hypothetical protein
MKREIYEVYAKVVDANGSYNTLSDYPKVFDSKLNNNDINQTLSKAYGEYYTTLGTLYKREDRQLQTVMLIRSDGLVLEYRSIGEIAEIADSTEDSNPEE